MEEFGGKVWNIPRVPRLPTNDEIIQEMKQIKEFKDASRRKRAWIKSPESYKYQSLYRKAENDLINKRRQNFHQDAKNANIQH